MLHEAPAAKLLVLSMQDDPTYVREAFAAGASGYVLKEAADKYTIIQLGVALFTPVGADEDEIKEDARKGVKLAA